MTISVLACGPTSESGKKLAEAIGAKYHTSSELCPKGQRDVLVRWGHGGGVDAPNTLNPGHTIGLNTAKHESLNVMEQEGISVPKIYLRKIPAGKKAVVRTYEHARGAGFMVLDGPATLPAGQFGTELIRTNHEYRIWFAGDRYRAAKRVAIRPEDNGICRSNWGYEVRECTSSQKQIVKAAAQAIGLDYGAADILWEPALGKYYVLELNSAPSLDTPGVLDFMSRNIKALITERFPNLTERRVACRRQSDRRAVPFRYGN